MNDTSAGRGTVRSRPVNAAAVPVVIGLGLGSRSDAAGLAWVVAKYAVDALWGMVAFLGIAFLLSHRRRGQLTPWRWCSFALSR